MYIVRGKITSQKQLFLGRETTPASDSLSVCSVQSMYIYLYGVVMTDATKTRNQRTRTPRVPALMKPHLDSAPSDR